MEHNNKTQNLDYEFLNNMSHQLRTPINVIMSSIQLLSMYIKEKGIYDEQLDRYVGYINKNALELIRISDNIIDLIYGYAVKDGLVFYKCDLAEWCESLILIVSNIIKNKGVSLKFYNNINSNYAYIATRFIDRVIIKLLLIAVIYSESVYDIVINIDDCEDYSYISVGYSSKCQQIQGVSNLSELLSPLNNNKFNDSVKSAIDFELSLIREIARSHEGDLVVNSCNNYTNIRMSISKHLNVKNNKNISDICKDPKDYEELRKILIEKELVNECEILVSMLR